MEGDAAAAMDVLLAPGSAEAPPLVSGPPAAPEAEEQQSVRQEMANMITDFKNTTDPDLAVDMFLELVDMAKRLV
jgi:hypothetical protein